MKKNINFLSFVVALAMSAALQASVAPKSPITPIAPKATGALKVITPVSAVAKTILPKAVTPVVPKVVSPVAQKIPVPVAPKAVTPVVAQAVIPKAVPVAPKAPAPAAKPVVIEQPLASQVVGVITVKNNSKFKASWTGWKTKYKTATGEVKYKLHTLKVPHELESEVKHKASKTLQPYTVHNLPANSYIEGVSDLMINNIPVIVDYKGSAWMPGVTDAIYITSSNGSAWKLDKKAMDKNYKKINSGIISNSEKEQHVQDSSQSVTDVTKAASVPVVLKNKKNQKKFKDIAKYSKSKSSKAFEHATEVSK